MTTTRRNPRVLVVTPEELAEVSAIVNKSVVALGTDQAFALRDS